MTKKQQLKMMEGWVKKFNPKAFLHRADARCGERYAVTTKNGEGCVRNWTPYYNLDTLEAVLMNLFRAEEFMEIKSA